MTNGNIKNEKEENKQPGGNGGLILLAIAGTGFGMYMLGHKKGVLHGLQLANAVADVAMSIKNDDSSKGGV